MDIRPTHTLPWLEGRDPFPSSELAFPANSVAPGLLAAGADLSPDRLISAYQRGIFPWFSDGEPILWWTTDPRMVLAICDFRLSRSLRKTINRFLKNPDFEIAVDKDFSQVIQACAHSKRFGQDGTWIGPEMINAYEQLHRLGFAHSVEIREKGDLIGGLYGVSIGRMFFGESMFSHKTDASKIALAYLVSLCTRIGIPWIDCQQQTAHLASMGAMPIPRRDFELTLQTLVNQRIDAQWIYDPSDWVK